MIDTTITAAIALLQAIVEGLRILGESIALDFNLPSLVGLAIVAFIFAMILNRGYTVGVRDPSARKFIVNGAIIFAVLLFAGKIIPTIQGWISNIL